MQDAEGKKRKKLECLRYGRFFYRFPHGESGADVYDRYTGEQGMGGVVGGGGGHKWGRVGAGGVGADGCGRCGGGVGDDLVGLTEPLLVLLCLDC